MPPPLWNLVLAAGSGRRLASVTGGVPKQFWRPGGSRSLLESTLERVAPFAPADRTLTVVDETHRPFLQALPGASAHSRVMFQPTDRGTAAGVLWPLTAILEQAPDAIVLLTPSDHGVAQPNLFQAGVQDAVTRVRADAAGVVLFGVQPAAPTGDYGWITPSRAVAREPLRRVMGFVEKPPAGDALQLFHSGAVWNTMVLVARAAALFELYWAHLPQLARFFARTLRVPEPARHTLLSAQYDALPTADFSHDVLGAAHGLSVYTWPAAMGWSDLGTPERFAEWSAGGRGSLAKQVA